MCKGGNALSINELRIQNFFYTNSKRDSSHNSVRPDDMMAVAQNGRHDKVAVGQAGVGRAEPSAKSQKIGRKVAESEGGWVENADFPAGGRVAIYGGNPNTPYICI